MVHINQSDVWGGAAIAASLLHRALGDSGAISRRLVALADKEDSHTAAIRRWPLEWRLGAPFRAVGLEHIYHLNSFALPSHPFIQASEIVHLHNIHNYYFNYLAIPRLSRRTPLVWTLHDMWAVTGHCAYSVSCGRWRHGCGKCPHLDTYPEVRRDSTAAEWRLKRWSFERANLTIVTPSRWLKGVVGESLLGTKECHYIPNGIDTDTLRPIDRSECRKRLGLASDALVLLFAAANLTDERKCGPEICKALSLLPDELQKQVVLLTFGQASTASPETGQWRRHDAGYVDSDARKAILFSAADILLAPTKADNSPMIIQEGLSCGIPVISSRIGGVPELVADGDTGLLLESEDPGELARRIEELLRSSELRRRCGESGRRVALREFGMKTCAGRHIELYQDLIHRHRSESVRRASAK